MVPFRGDPATTFNLAVVTCVICDKAVTPNFTAQLALGCST